jgi:hypothetical protein
VQSRVGVAPIGFEAFEIGVDGLVEQSAREHLPRGMKTRHRGRFILTLGAEVTLELHGVWEPVRVARTDEKLCNLYTFL